MTDQVSSNPMSGPGVPAAAGPPAGLPTAAGSVAGQAVPAMPDDAVMISEIDRDRRHERYLVRAAAVASVVIAIALAIRLVWG